MGFLPAQPHVPLTPLLLVLCPALGISNTAGFPELQLGCQHCLLPGCYLWFPLGSELVIPFFPLHLFSSVYIFVLQEEGEEEAAWKGQITPCTPLPEETRLDWVYSPVRQPKTQQGILTKQI